MTPTEANPARPALTVRGDAQQRLHLAFGHLLRAERDQALEVAGMAGVRAGPRDRLDAHPAVAALHAAQLVGDKAAPPGDVQVPPAPPRAVVAGAVDLPAARAHRPPAPQRNEHRDRL